MVTEEFSKSAVDEVSGPLPHDLQSDNSTEVPERDSNDNKTLPPLLAKLFAVALISCISFGSHWSSGVTSAMKSTIKKVRRQKSLGRHRNVR